MQMFKTLDALLRGGFTDTDNLKDGQIALSVSRLVKTALVLGALYGVMMGLYSLFTWESKSDAALQMLSTASKVPLLFLLTLLITFPSLYVVSALARTRLGASDTARLLLIVIVVDLALLASLGPITAFFTVSTTSYPFMVLLNVLFFAVAGLAGLTFLRRSLGNLLGAESREFASNLPEDPADDDTTLTEEQRRKRQLLQDDLRWRTRQQDSATIRTRRLFASWCILFGVVGSQMGWVLRPFIGSPDAPFEWFRNRESNFLSAVFSTIGKLFQ